METDPLISPQVIALIQKEAQYALDKHGDFAMISEDLYTGLRYLILAEEVGEVANALLEHDHTALVGELIQVAAMAACWLEAIGAS